MNKSILFFCFFVGYFSSNYACAKKTTIRNNDIYFTGHAGSVNFQMTSKCITHGQSFDKILNKSSLHGLNIRAGRKGSKEVVKCVQK